MNTVVLKHMNYMLSSSEVYFHRKNTLNLTNTNLGKSGKNNNPFQRDSYLQNINTILCIVIKYKTSIQYWHVGPQSLCNRSFLVAFVCVVLWFSNFLLV